jgi:hypothetical protein
MMQNSNKNYFTAGLLILLGIIFLGREFDFLDFHWGDIARFWPILLILIGVNVLLGGKSGGSASWVFFILFLLAIPFGIVRKCENKMDEKGFHWNHRDWDNDNDNNNDNSNNDENDEENTERLNSKSQFFSEDMSTEIKSAKLTLEGGVAGIDIDGTTEKLFEADTKTTFTDFGMSKTIENGKANLKFTMNGKNGKDHHIDIDTDNIDGKNEAKIKLNPNISWDMEYKFGVSGADLDLSPFEVNNLDIKTGVSGVDIKLGDKASNMQLDIDAGMAGIKIKVPSSVGVRIKADDFLSSNHFQDFKKDGSNYYISPDYDKSSKKITINYKGAFASFDVDRY